MVRSVNFHIMLSLSKDPERGVLPEKGFRNISSDTQIGKN